MKDIRLHSVLMLAFGLAGLAATTAHAATVKKIISRPIYFVEGNKVKITYDISVRRTSAGQGSNGEYRMGNSSFLARSSSGALSEFKMTNVNPKYTAGSPSDGYDAAEFRIMGNNAYVQIFCKNRGFTCSDSGDNIVPLNVTERIATITATVNDPRLAHSIYWNRLDSAVVSIQFEGGGENMPPPAPETWYGDYQGKANISFRGSRHGAIGEPIGPN